MFSPQAPGFPLRLLLSMHYGLLLNVHPVSLHFSSGKPDYSGALGTIVPALGCPQERISIERYTTFEAARLCLSVMLYSQFQ